MDLPDWSWAVVSGIAAAFLQGMGFIVIGAAVLRGQARPNRCSWMIWSVVASLAAAGSWLGAYLTITYLHRTPPPLGPAPQ